MLVPALFISLALGTTATSILLPNSDCSCSNPAPPCPQQSYKVSLDNCGPRPFRLPPKSVCPVTTCPVVRPPVVLPYKVPLPRTVSNVCRCVKTIVKPQVIEQEIVVPVVKKFVQTLAKPSIQVLEYFAEPINCPKVECYADEPCGQCSCAVQPVCSTGCVA